MWGISNAEVLTPILAEGYEEPVAVYLELPVSWITSSDQLFHLVQVTRFTSDIRARSLTSNRNTGIVLSGTIKKWQVVHKQNYLVKGENDERRWNP
jgi:hypothetical protein